MIIGDSPRGKRYSAVVSSAGIGAELDVEAIEGLLLLSFGLPNSRFNAPAHDMVDAINKGLQDVLLAFCNTNH